MANGTQLDVVKAQLSFLESIHGTEKRRLRDEFRWIVRSFKHLIPYKRCAMWLINTEAGTATLAAVEPESSSTRRQILPLNDCITHTPPNDPRQVILVRNPSSVHDGLTQSLKNMISVPVLWPDTNKLMAQVLVYPEDQSDSFKLDPNIFEVVRSHVSLALLHSLRSEQATLQDEFLELGGRAALQSKYPTLVCEKLMSYIPSEGWSIFLYDRVRHRLEIESTSGLVGNPPMEDVFYSLNHRSIGLAARERRLINIADTSKLPMSGGKHWREATVHESKSVLLAPVQSTAGELIGMIRLRNRQGPGNTVDTFSWFDEQLITRASEFVGTHLQIVAEARTRAKMLRLLMHEVNNPAATIKWTSRRLRSRFHRIEVYKIMSELDDISDAAELLIWLYDGIHRFVRPENERLKAYDFKATDLNDDILKSVRRAFVPLAKSLKRTPEEELPHLKLNTQQLSLVCDPPSIAVMLLNLLRNAVKYGRGADGVLGEIALSARRGQYTGKAGSVELQISDAVIMSISDNGIGIPEAEAERIFEPGVRLDAATEWDAKGVGLGLSLARQIASDHGGWLFVTSTKEPTTFTIVLPKQGPHAARMHS